MNLKNIINFFFEIGQLKRKQRIGWHTIGTVDVETIGAHSLRAAQMAYIIARMEKYENPYEIVTAVVFHDLAESRTGDLDSVSKHYTKRDEDKAVHDQTAELGEIGKEIKYLWHIAEDRSNHAGQIAKDADYLELIVTAKEQLAKGVKGAQIFIDSTLMHLKTESAKKLCDELLKSDPDEWWTKLNDLADLSPVTE